MSFVRRFGDKYGKRLMNTAAKKEIDAAKATSKRVVHKTTEARGDLIGNSWQNHFIRQKKEKKEKEDERQKIYIPPEKQLSKLLMT